MEDLLCAEGLSSEELGWLKLRYTGVFLGLGAQLTLYDNKQIIGVDSPRSLSADFKSQSRSAAYFIPEGGTAKLALTNTSKDNLLVDMHCGSFSKNISISGSGTDIELLSRSDISRDQFVVNGAASCDITSDGDPTTLRVVGVVNGKHGYAAPIRFYDPATATFPSLTAVGVDTSADTVIVLHNLSDEPVRYTPTMVEATLKEPTKIVLPAAILRPHSDDVLNISRALTELKRQMIPVATVTFQSNAPNGAFVGSLTQINLKEDLIEDIPFRTANRAGNAAGAYPLRWENDYTNLVTVTNTSSETLVARSVITVGEVSYVPAPRTIEPGRTAVYDVDEMRRDQVKDINGRAIPLGPDFGKFMWFDSEFGSKKGLMGRNSVTSRSNHRKSSFSCGMSCGYTFDRRPVFDNNPFGVGPFGSVWGGPIVERTNLSNGQTLDGPYPFSSTQLASSNSSILNYAADPSSSTSYNAITGNSGLVSASYYEFLQQEAYDQFGDCQPFVSEGPVNGSAGTQLTISYTGQSQPINGTTQDVWIGQQIALTASFTLANGASVNSQGWSVPGTTVGGYVASLTGASVVPYVDIGNKSTVFYWLDPGVKAVTFTLTPTEGPQTSATVTFNVQAPSVNPTVSTGSVRIKNNNVMQLSPQRLGGGINFSASSLLNPPTYGGSYSWVQLVTSSTTVAKDPAGTPYVCTYGPGLDTSYPYSSMVSTNDSPGVPLPPSYVEVTDSDSFRMYLQWQLSAPASIPVSFAYVDWGWSGDALKDSNGVWTLATSSIAPHVFVQNYSLPIWSDYVSTSQPHGVSCH